MRYQISGEVLHLGEVSSPEEVKTNFAEPLEELPRFGDISMSGLHLDKVVLCFSIHSGVS